MKYTWLMFVAGAILSWGAYVVTIDHGRQAMASGVPRAHMAVAAMRAFLFIGLAYCVMGIIVPLIYLKLYPIPAGQDPGFNTRAVTLSTIAGILGAAGALCIVFAVGHARRISPQAALMVAPLVFCFAPIVNAIISLVIHPPHTAPKPWFFVGMLLAAAGAALVLRFKPEETPSTPAPTTAASTTPSTPAQNP